MAVGKKEQRSKKTGASIVDIAEALNISAATVSRALNGHARISEETKRKVKKKAQEMGYVVNRMASSLRKNRSGIVGLIVPRISMHFHTVFITSLQRLLQEAGYRLMIAQSDDDGTLERDLVEAMFSSRVDALVISLSLTSEDYSVFDNFIENRIPVVFYDRVPLKPIPYTYTFVGDDFGGGYAVARHLAGLGAKKIAYISGPLSCNLYRDRTLGFLKGLQDESLSLKDEWVFYQELTVENARKSIELLFAKRTKPDAIFAANDNTAITILEFARKERIAVPHDLKIVGYSNDPKAAIISPAITTVDQYPEEMANKVSQLILKVLHKQEQLTEKPLPVVTPVQLLIKGSTDRA
ncbi:LacI family DNA-binding transcriptional regulator [Olivibacter sitiensis]|uniref:LacI family DNA-binding transcriptional regulator n=1 Tax=Olivibacter sitiensis TaxID=376470 RepID=UPI0003FC0C64|nr:LacI family DNA-binding transcriptional regulator [Olivibacter sitiensis]